MFFVFSELISVSKWLVVLINGVRVVSCELIW